MNIYRLVWVFHLDGVADLLCLQAVVAGIAASVCLYSISCYLVAATHHFLAHVNHRCLIFFFFSFCLLHWCFVCCRLFGCRLMMLWLLDRIGCQLLLRLGNLVVFVGCGRWGSFSMDVLRSCCRLVGWRHLLSVDQFIDGLALGNGNRTQSWCFLLYVLQVSLGKAHSSSAEHDSKK